MIEVQRPLGQVVMTALLKLGHHPLLHVFCVCTESQIYLAYSYCREQSTLVQVYCEENTQSFLKQPCLGHLAWNVGKSTRNKAR